MKKNYAYGKELEFITQILGDGTVRACEKDIHPALANTKFTLTCLSITNGTYIASGFCTYVVKIKADVYMPKNNWEMAEALMDGKTCRVPKKYVKDVFEALAYHTLKAEVEVEKDFVTIKPL